jgi:type IV pilus assembly protein PilE
MKQEKGFTLIELLVITVVISILAGLSIRAYSLYTIRAAKGAAKTVMHHAEVTYEAGTTNTQDPPPSVSITQNTPGPLENADARKVFLGFVLSKSINFSALYDSECIDETCTQAEITIGHCAADTSSLLTRYGDGRQVLLDGLEGNGCS